MHRGGATVNGQTLSARRRGWEIELDEPAPQGPCGWQLKVGEIDTGKMLGEDNADKVRAPVGMVAAESLRLKEDGVIGQTHRGGIRAVVSSSGYAVVVEVSLAEQILDRAKAEVETQGDGVAIEVLHLVSLPQGFAGSLVDGARHGASLLLAWAGLDLYPYPIPRKTWCPDLAQKVMAGNSPASSRPRL
jgi:hypothetical protein